MLQPVSPMTDNDASLYDQVFYPGHAYDQTHPDRLATLAALYGMEPAPVAGCRMLELGCGIGGNLIPMASQWPESTFIGIDLSARSIEKGRENVAALGLTNLDLRHGDIMQLPADLGRFDYIVAHGVYSWVPAPVREKILDVFAVMLNPQGVGYISYNAYPGSHLRNLARDIMHHHVRELDDPREKVLQSRAILKALFDASTQNEIYGVILRDQFERVRKMPDEVLYHDDLNPITTPFLVTDVVDAAERHGLQFLSEATFSSSHLGSHPDKVMALLGQIPVHEVMAREQYLDFAIGRGFRETLLCHGDIALDREIGPARVRRFHVGAYVKQASGEADPAAPGVATYNTERGRTITTDHRLSKAALLHLGSCWPGTVAFAELVERALERLGDDAARVRASLDEEVEALTITLFSAYAGGQVELHCSAPRLTTGISARPQACAVARRQAQSGSLVTNRRHGSVYMEDEVTRRFLLLVDGTRSVDDLVADLTAALTREPPRVAEGEAAPEVTRATVERNLRLLATLGLLVR
jgi:SAM-dependent methyltransferase